MRNVKWFSFNPTSAGGLLRGIWIDAKRHVQRYHASGEWSISRCGIVEKFKVCSNEMISLFCFPKKISLTLFSMVDIILCQSAVRRFAAIKERSMLWDALCTRSATTIKTSWRTCSAKARYFRIRSNVILLQSIIRQWKTERHLQ